MCTHLEVIVHHRNDLPGGLPAIWVRDDVGSTAVVNLYLRHDLPQELQDAYRCMVTRDVFPGVDLDLYAITAGNDRVTTLRPFMFA